jgi:adenosylcobyric acid synthase
MTCRAIMILGTGSDVGKSLIVAGLARAFAGRGLRVAPFKPQNMSNNAAVTADGGEIGRAQALQALAARQPASVDMNPVLLKPESSTGAQIIVRGKRVATLKAREFFAQRHQFMGAIRESFQRLCEANDLVIIEGAGSPAEVNLRQGDLANLGFASAVDIPCLLVGDIHRGGVIASLVGTLEVLSEEDQSLIKGFVINKFHGDLHLFDEGRSFLEKRTGLPCLGVVPHFADASKLPAEDALALEQNLAPIPAAGSFPIAVLRLPRIANFDDLDPLRMTPGVTLHFVHPGDVIPADVKLVIIPGSKSTIADLAAVRAAGWDIDIRAHVRRGGHVLGLCGGYQMLGHSISDPLGIEGPAMTVAGLGLLDVHTILNGSKTLDHVSGVHVASGEAIGGYEIHLGKTTGADCSRPFAMIGDRPDGATSADGLVIGTYMHGCFGSDRFRQALLASLGAETGDFSYSKTVETVLDSLALHIEAHLDLEAILSMARPV